MALRFGRRKSRLSYSVNSYCNGSAYIGLSDETGKAMRARRAPVERHSRRREGLTRKHRYLHRNMGYTFGRASEA